MSGGRRRGVRANEISESFILMSLDHSFGRMNQIGTASEDSTRTGGESNLSIHGVGFWYAPQRTMTCGW